MSNFKSCKLRRVLREIEKENYSAIEEFQLGVKRIGTTYDDEPIMMEVINSMRDVLLNKGYSIAYENFPSGHDYLGWGETVATGLIALIGIQLRGINLIFNFR